MSSALPGRRIAFQLPVTRATINESWLTGEWFSGRVSPSARHLTLLHIGRPVELAEELGIVASVDVQAFRSELASLLSWSRLGSHSRYLVRTRFLTTWASAQYNYLVLEVEPGVQILRLRHELEDRFRDLLRSVGVRDPDAFMVNSVAMAHRQDWAPHVTLARTTTPVDFQAILVAGEIELGAMRPWTPRGDVAREGDA